MLVIGLDLFFSHRLNSIRTFQPMLLDNLSNSQAKYPTINLMQTWIFNDILKNPPLTAKLAISRVQSPAGYHSSVIVWIYVIQKGILVEEQNQFLPCSTNVPERRRGKTIEKTAGKKHQSLDRHRDWVPGIETNKQKERGRVGRAEKERDGILPRRRLQSYNLPVRLFEYDFRVDVWYLNDLYLLMIAIAGAASWTLTFAFLQLNF